MQSHQQQTTSKPSKEDEETTQSNGGSGDDDDEEEGDDNDEDDLFQQGIVPESGFGMVVMGCYRSFRSFQMRSDDPGQQGQLFQK